jgi:putative protease
MPPAPEILAPAGNRPAFLAALAAGADAIYCGLKRFSARMEAQNFEREELARLIELAHRRGSRVYLTLNTLLRPGELDEALRELHAISRQAPPDALIVQDPGVPALARQAGFTGEIHLSTLANVTHPLALGAAAACTGAARIVMPRELTIDEIKALDHACPPQLGLEIFIHGALCYGVSGRCYWSSFLGGKSGLRGRCVQPCRRLYAQGAGSGERFFSCLDLSLDVLVRVLRPLPRIRGWKIEGRKKGPHYVYYCVTAYRMLRDEGGDAKARRAAVEMLAHSLGRPMSHYRFLPQRPRVPLEPQRVSASGMLVGSAGGRGARMVLVPREPLLAGDLLRVGLEDQPGHGIARVPRAVPKGGTFVLPLPRPPGASGHLPVYLIDRREPELVRLLTQVEAELPAAPPPPPAGPAPELRLPRPRRGAGALIEMTVWRAPGRARSHRTQGLWLEPGAVPFVPSRLTLWWWLPPVIWPEQEAAFQELIAERRAAGECRFVLNAPWQAALFQAGPGLELWAGPFCNLANPLSIAAMAALGCQGAFASPELGGQELLALPAASPLPLGVVVGGFWPLCLSRIKADALQAERSLRSPRGEEAWLSRHGANWWLFPNWRLDLGAHKAELLSAGFRMLAVLEEKVPTAVTIKKRPGVWNWELGLR